MVKFISKIFLFGCMISLLVLCMFYYFYKIGGNDLPAPPFSNSISFNEKIDFIKNKDLSTIEYVVLGSSMSLNNIDSETMVRALGENYLNLASWGFKISDTENYLKNMSEFFPNLKTVIISTSFMDFSSTTRNIIVDYNMIRNSISYKSDFLIYILSPDLKYFYNNSKENRKNKQIRNSYQNLVYDKFGGAILDIDSDKIDRIRWNNDILNFDVSEKELKNLESVIAYLNTKGIRCVIAIPPQRQGLIDEQKIMKIKIEIEKIRNVVFENNGIFVDSFELLEWNDSFFVDYCHLNKAGAEKYTEYVLSKIIR